MNIIVGSPFKNWVRCGPAPLRLGVAAGYPMKYVHLPLFHHAEFGRSTSKGVGISKGCPKILARRGPSLGTGAVPGPYKHNSP